MKNDRIFGIKDLIDLMDFLCDKPVNFYDYDCTIYYVEEQNVLVIDNAKIKIYRKAPELTYPRFIEDIKLLEAMSNRYIPIIDKDTKQNMFTLDEFINYRKKMSGLKEYGTGDFIFSDNLTFEGLDYYLNLIDKNINDVKRHLNPVLEEIKRVINSEGLTVTVGLNTGGDVELIETGSTNRYTNVPSSDDNPKWDFDFTVRMDPDKIWLVKNILEKNLQAKGHITRTSNYKVRLTDVIVPGLEKTLDLDFSLTPQKDKYLSTEAALSERLNNMKKQDENKYRLVVANIMYAKTYLKEAGVYKPSRGILDGDRSFGGLGGVGIENWILQYGGSFEDAARDFLAHAEGKTFKEFEKEYVIMDFGKDHVSTSKGEFPYHNFIMRNMRYKGFEIMIEALKKIVNDIDKCNRKTL